MASDARLPCPIEIEKLSLFKSGLMKTETANGKVLFTRRCCTRNDRDLAMSASIIYFLPFLRLCQP